MKASEIAEKLFEIEQELDLFNQQIQGIYFWKLIRFEVFIQLSQKLGVYEQAHLKEFNSIFDKIKALFPKIKNTYLHSVFTRNSKVDVLIVEHGRKVLIDDGYVDIYTEHKVNELEHAGASYEIVDKLHVGRHYHKPSKNRSYFEGITISYLIKNFLKQVKFTQYEEKFIKAIEDNVKEVFGVNIGKKVLLQKRITVFYNKKIQYINMLKKRAVKQVYLVVSYGHEALIAACQELGVECVELQHGTMNYYHVGYSFPYNEKIPYFPDKLELFGKYWQDSTPLPLKPEDISISGYTHLNNMLINYKDFKKEKNRVVFISQGTVATQMSKVALELAKENSHIEVYYKLHPGEFGRWRNEYKYLQKAAMFENLHVIENEIHLYELMAMSEFLVGVYSTAIFEGLTLQCKTILLDLPGVEFLEYLIKEDIVKMARNKEDVLKLMQNDDFKKIDRDYFFKE